MAKRAKWINGIGLSIFKIGVWCYCCCCCRCCCWWRWRRWMVGFWCWYNCYSYCYCGWCRCMPITVNVIFWAHVAHSVRCLFVHCIYAGHALNIQQKSHNRNTNSMWWAYDGNWAWCERTLLALHKGVYRVPFNLRDTKIRIDIALSHTLIHNFGFFFSSSEGWCDTHSARHHTQLYKHNFFFLSFVVCVFFINKWLIFHIKRQNAAKKPIHMHERSESKKNVP